MDELITVDQLREIVQVSRTTIDRWRKEGLPTIKIGKRAIRFEKGKALEWIKNNVDE